MPPDVKLGPGEALWPGKPEEANQTEWAIAGGKRVILSVVKLGKDEKGNDVGVLRAFHEGRSHDVERFSVGATDKGERWAIIETLPNGRALFRYVPSASATAKNARVALVLGWDDKAQRVRVVKRWQGPATATEPTWASMGEGALTLGEAGQGLCDKVLRKIAACRNDKGFRESLFRTLAAEERTRSEKELAALAATWKKKGAAKAQCEKWSGADYQATHFTEPTDLAELAKDAELDCTMFGRELDDQGGLPRKAPE
jgi:hypothetical protein